MSYAPTEATHVVFAPPKVIDGTLHRGVVATDLAETVTDQLNRDLWTVVLFLHGPTVPCPHPNIDLYLTSATFADQCPTPQLHLTARNLVRETEFFPLQLEKQYDVILNATWMSFKRHELLIDALCDAKQQGRPLRCVWFGYHWCSGWEKREQELKQTVMANELDVDFLPTNFDVAEINRRYNLCHTALICSSMEAGPRVMGEAMLADLPYIATRDTYGGSPELVTAECGIRCEPHGQAIAAAIWQAIDQRNTFAPREWALENLCVSAAMRDLNHSLVEIEKANDWRINREELDFPGFDWQAKQATVRRAEADCFLK